MEVKTKVKVISRYQKWFDEGEVIKVFTTAGEDMKRVGKVVNFDQELGIIEIHHKDFIQPSVIHLHAIAIAEPIGNKKGDRSFGLSTKGEDNED